MALKIISHGESSIGIKYSKYMLPEGAELFLYNENVTHIIGAFTSFNNKANLHFQTQPVKGDTITIELYLPSDSTGVQFEISQVLHSYREIYRYGQSAICNNNVNCPEWFDWFDQKRSVGRLDLGGGICSGVLINNAEDVVDDTTQYFLTAANNPGLPARSVLKVSGGKSRRA